MTSTTIKVSTETRDRLKAQAAASQITLGEHLERLATAADRALRFEAMRAAITATPGPVQDDLDEETRRWLEDDLGA